MFKNKPSINPKTSPYVPETTKTAFQGLEQRSDRLKNFFAETFYYRLGRDRKELDFVENMREGLFRGIQNDDCFVGHVLEPSEGVHDEIILSTPKALVLFHCEEQQVTREHPNPLHAALKFVHPQEGLYIQPNGSNGVFTINFGTVSFNEFGIQERRDYPRAWTREEEKLWKEHLKRWGIVSANDNTVQNSESTQKGIRVKLFDLLRWSALQPKSDPPRGNLFVPYLDFQKRIQNINYTLSKGLHAINSHIQEVSDDPEEGEAMKRY